MSSTGTSVAQVQVLVEGSPMNSVVAALLISAEVELSIFAPSHFRLVFRGPRQDVLGMGGFQLGVPVTIKAEIGDAATPLLTDAEVTSAEMEYGPDGDLTIVKGMDLSSRLMRGTSTKGYPNMSASDVARQVASGAGLELGNITATTKIYELLTQANISNWVFLQQIAALENCIAYVGTDGRFNFCPLKSPSQGPPPVAGPMTNPSSGNQLVMKNNLIRLRGKVTGAEQVPSVSVRGYDAKQASALTGVRSAAPSTFMSSDSAVVPAMVANAYQSSAFVDTSHPFDDQGSAEKRAEAIVADIAGALGELEGQCLGSPDILAGEPVSVGAVGPPFDGQYICTVARHVFEPDHGGYSTWFNLGGRRDRSIYGLAVGGSMGGEGPRPRISGVVVATVSDNNDPLAMGRVKLTFPWLDADYVGGWARTVQLGASGSSSSNGGGSLWLPEVGDEVLVAFDRGQVDYPYVIGNVYNGAAKPNPAPDTSQGIAYRRFTSRKLHQIQFDDGPDKSGVTIQTGQGSCTINLDDQQGNITIQAQNGAVTIQASKDLTLKSDTGNISIEATLGQVSVSGNQGISIESDSGQLSAKAPSGVTLEGSTIALSGASVSLGG